MSEEVQKTWVDEMIERESIPKVLRTETIEVFCQRHGIAIATYHYQSSKKENQEQVLELSLNVAKKEMPEVLDVLLKNAKSGKEKSIEIYLDYIVKLSKNLDIKSNGEKLASVDLDEFLTLYAQKHNSKAKDSSSETDI